ncbi:MAG: hypothetical protein RMH84_03980 [Sulfolobales archaeon]|nr:hypothetical protein [Sulfolobales archaeon]MCX8208925.1 hypothetical protein [Sulfolobales archaeon]MDW8010733.1 hypothetical protein [Sulfolobales archaeon]
MKILEVSNIPLALALKKLLECEKRGLIVKGLAKRTMELAESLKRCENPEKLYEELVKLGLSDLTASMVVDTAPKSIDEVRILLSFESSSSVGEIVSRVVELVSTYCYKQS